MPGIVVSIHVAPYPHAPMISLPIAHLVPGKGIEGDRFYTQPKQPQPGTKTPYEVTLVEQEALLALAALDPATAAEPSGRRNMMIRSCTLRTLAGCLFRVGEVLLYGATVREAACESPHHSQQDICGGLHHRWLGASILTEGSVVPDDRIEMVSFTLEEFQREQAQALLIQPKAFPEG